MVYLTVIPCDIVMQKIINITFITSESADVLPVLLSSFQV